MIKRVDEQGPQRSDGDMSSRSRPAKASSAASANVLTVATHHIAPGPVQSMSGLDRDHCRS